MSGYRTVDAYFACSVRKWEGMKLIVEGLLASTLAYSTHNWTLGKLKSPLLPFLFSNRKSFTSLATITSNCETLKHH